MVTDADEVVVSFREAGVYPAVFTECRKDQVTEAATGDKNDVLVWVFKESDDESMDTLTGRQFTPRSKATKLLTGILGRPIRSGDKPSDAYGTMVNVVYGQNQNGKLTVTDVLPHKGK